MIDTKVRVNMSIPEEWKDSHDPIHRFYYELNQWMKEEELHLLDFRSQILEKYDQMIDKFHEKYPLFTPVYHITYIGDNSCIIDPLYIKVEVSKGIYELILMDRWDQEFDIIYNEKEETNNE